MVKPWYKQFWPWFLIALPLTVVVWTIITVIIFAQNEVSLVTEDYYKKGKGINIDLSKIKIAKELQLQAEVMTNGREIVIQFDRGQLDHYPALSAEFAHRTLEDRDFSRMLSSDAKGNYRFIVDETIDIKGPWFVKLSPHDGQWIIQGRVNFPSSLPTRLMN